MENTKLLPLGTEQGLEETEYPSFDLCLGESMDTQAQVKGGKAWYHPLWHNTGSG